MRNPQIDVLRFLGLSLIILAHVYPPGVIFQLRNFDVPLMVLISGASFMLSSSTSNYRSYVWKRIKRLAFPAWTFLTIYFSCLILFKLDWDKTDFPTMISSYGFFSGIGFLWIIRIFLTMAILAPFLSKLNTSVISTKHFLIYIGLAFGVYELICQAGSIAHGAPSQIFKVLLLPTIGYSLIFLLGLRIQKMSKPQIGGAITISLFWFFAYAGVLYLQDSLTDTQTAKYPPNTYYLSYAVALSFICWLIVSNLPKLVFPDIVFFISRNTLWIYFWHIVYIKSCGLDKYDFHLGSYDFILRYLLLYFLSVLSYFIQYSLFQRIIFPKIRNESVKKNLSVLFIG